MIENKLESESNHVARARQWLPRSTMSIESPGQELSGECWWTFLQDFHIEHWLISRVEDHLTGSLTEPKAMSLTHLSSCWQVSGL